MTSRARGEQCRKSKGQVRRGSSVKFVVEATLDFDRGFARCVVVLQDLAFYSRYVVYVEKGAKSSLAIRFWGFALRFYSSGQNMRACSLDSACFRSEEAD